ncbi:hypothetical protein BH10BAC5_BH10BAC5_07020 [soil metagenome]
MHFIKKIFILTSLIFILFTGAAFTQSNDEAQKGDSVAIDKNNLMIDKNFISNPDAETTNASGIIPGWENITNNSQNIPIINAGTYGSSDNQNNAILKSGYGNYYFNAYVGGEHKDASAFQYVDLSPLSDEIDAGNILYNMSGNFSGVNNSFALLSVQFLSGPGNDIGTYYTNNLAADEINPDDLVLVPRVKAGDVPKGSRKMVIQLKFYNLEETDTSFPAFADNLSVILLRKP